jgi:hypothetical protein
MSKTVAKGTVQFVEEKKREGKPTAYWIVVDGTKYWDSKGNFKDSTGKAIDFEWETSQDGSFKFINPIGGAAGGFKGGGGGSRSSNESFAASYSKDIVIACIQNSTLKSSADIEGGLIHFFQVFMKLLTTGK